MTMIAVWHMALATGCAGAVGCAATWLVVALTRRCGLFDQPNERSAHTAPTPTAGGLGVVAGFWAGVAVLYGAGSWVGEGLGGWLAASALLLLAVIDDWLRPMRPWEKILLLLAAIAAWLAWAPHLQWLAVPGLGQVALGWWGWPLTVAWFFFLCNAFNFMDGIDGLSGLQTLCTALWTGALLWGLGSAAGPLAWVLAAATAGFLVFNLPPARIFMGDVGALFIGFSVAACGIFGAQAGLPLWCFGMVLAVYIFDVGYTLVRRGLRGENLTRAHRKHLYQRLDRIGWSHWRIDAVAVGITSLMGLGVYGYLIGLTASLGLCGLGGIALVAGAAWIEARDPDFV